MEILSSEKLLASDFKFSSLFLNSDKPLLMNVSSLFTPLSTGLKDIAEKTSRKSTAAKE
jgi:hypothetical protein